MALVYIRHGENPEIAIKRFRREVERDNILRELKERRYHLKPTMVKKMELVKLEKKLKRAARKRRYILKRTYS